MLLHASRACGPRAQAARPFTAARPQLLRRVRAAEPEADAADSIEEVDIGPEEPAVIEETPFNYNDAKKGNTYEPSEVQAALAFYNDGASEPFISGHVTNPLPVEDAALFDDVDNNEAYEEDEYSAVGIGEAAPKSKQGGQQEEGNDGMTEEQLMEIEGAKLTAAALDEVGVNAEDLDLEDANQPWAWEDASGEAAWQLTAPVPGGDEEQVLAGLAALEMSQVEDVTLAEDTRDIASIIIDDLAQDADVLDLEEDDENLEALEEEPALTAAEEGEIEALLAEPLPPTPQIEEVYVPEAEAGVPLDDAAVAEYIKALQAVTAGDASSLVEALGGEQPEVVTSNQPVPELPNTDVSLVAELMKEDPVFEAALDADAGEGGDLPTEAILAQLQEIAAIPAVEYGEALLPDEADLPVLEDLLDASAGYLEALGEEGTSELALEAAGDELDAINMYDDMPADLIARSGPLDDEDETEDGRFVERVLELSRVTKVVKGGKIMGFRATVVVGNGAGQVGVGCQAGREVGTAVKRALVDAKKNLITVPLVGSGTIPHRVEAWFKGAGVVILPASDGTGVIAGSSIRSVLELAGVKNVLAKRLGSRSQLNNARVAIKALEQLRTLSEVARARGVPVSYLQS